jgi:hypothetical protein
MSPFELKFFLFIKEPPREEEKLFFSFLLTYLWGMGYLKRLNDEYLEFKAE